MRDCECCGRPDAQVVCHPCVCHRAGDSPAWLIKRDRDHIEMWRGDLEAERMRHRASLTRHEAKTGKLNADIAELRQELKDRPTIPVNLDDLAVQEAKAETAAAYERRDSAFRSLAKLRVLHRDTGNGQCRHCRKPVSECAETQLLNDERSFLKWEAYETRRLRMHGYCALPDGHPALVNPRWVAPGSALH
jgi:hypothetical protein